jgi:hypothetical protein
MNESIERRVINACDAAVRLVAGASDSSTVIGQHDP